ncbi:hypothetical protein BC829DRAFT_154058 [Chytridium lagenaria]|nr:hypothetical protein BC829DRAFT_154058 [Chytridium lagenaria]
MLTAYLCGFPKHACYIHLYLTSKIKLTEQREALSIWVFGTFRIRLSDRAISSSSGYRASIVNVNGDIRILDYVIGSSTGSVLIDVDEWRRRLESSGVLRFSICLCSLELGERSPAMTSTFRVSQGYSHTASGFMTKSSFNSRQRSVKIEDQLL